MFPDGPRSIYLVLGHTDMRKGADTLAIVASQHGRFNPCDGSLYVFCNRQRTIVKILYWDRNGFCLFQKKLDKIHFYWPTTKNEVMSMEQRELRWLLDGLDVKKISVKGDGIYKRTR